MNKYGRAAVTAVTLYTSGNVSSPVAAWEIASSELFGAGTAAQKKACPRNAFLGLCAAGLVRGVPKGHYTSSQDNKRYALEAVKVLQSAPTVTTDAMRLWELVMRGERKRHNSQMNVVIALWTSNLIQAS